MRIPSRDSFTPLPEVCAYLGLSDPTEVLHDLENQLELVPDSMNKLRDIVEGVQDARDALASGAADVSWEGSAAEAFTAKVDWGLGALIIAILALYALVFETFPSISEAIADAINGLLDWLCPEDPEPVTPHCPEC